MAEAPQGQATVRITDIFRIPAIEPERLGQEDLLVRYVINNRHTFDLRIPNADATEAEIQAAVQKDARKWANIVGREFPV